MIEVLDDGFETVKVTTPDGQTKEERVDLHILGYAIREAAKESGAAGEPDSKWYERVIALLADKGFPGLSGKAADEVSEKVVTALKGREGKSSATPPPG